MKKQWKLDNKGMTLLEVIVAFAIFAIAATILITGFNGALKVMGNSEAIKDASQESASDIELELDGDKKLGTVITSNGYRLTGSFYIAETAKKNNDGLSVTQQSFVVDALTKPTAPEPPEEEQKEPVIGENDQIFNINNGKYTDEVAKENKYQIGKITQTVSFNHNSKENGEKCDLRQLYFETPENTPPFTFTGNADMVFDLDYLVINNSFDAGKAGALYVKNQYSPKESNKRSVLIYFPRDITIKHTEKKESISLEVPSGYYLITVPSDKATEGINIVTATLEQWNTWKVEGSKFDDAYKAHVTDLWK